MRGVHPREEEGAPVVTIDPFSLTGVAEVRRENKRLHAKVKELEAVNAFLADKVDLHIDQLTEELMQTQRLPDDDVLHAALSGLKEAKDMLRGYTVPSAFGGTG